MSETAPTPTRKRNWTIYLLAGLVLAAGAGFAGWQLFAPKASTTVDQSLMMSSSSEPVAVRSGTLSGADRFHNVEGTVTVFRDGGAYFLRFEDYDATSGPDVYFYLTPSANAGSASEVENEGLRVLVPGGASGGQATLRGNFNVPLPADFDATMYNGLVVWCDRFNVEFGRAMLA